MGKAVGFDEFEGMFDEGDVDVLPLLDSFVARPVLGAFVAACKATRTMPARAVDEAERAMA